MMTSATRTRTSATRTRTSAYLAGMAIATAAASACSPSPPADTFLTRAERTDYRETSSYADVVDFLERPRSGAEHTLPGPRRPDSRQAG